jgi:hypothetical protein
MLNATMASIFFDALLCGNSPPARIFHHNRPKPLCPEIRRLLQLEIPAVQLIENRLAHQSRIRHALREFSYRQAIFLDGLNASHRPKRIGP